MFDLIKKLFQKKEEPVITKNVSIPIINDENHIDSFPMTYEVYLEDCKKDNEPPKWTEKEYREQLDDFCQWLQGY